MTSKETILTAEGLAKLEAELEELRTVKRLENEERLHEAIAHGDLSENSEYVSAKDEQARIEGRQLLILKILLRNLKKTACSLIPSLARRKQIPLRDGFPMSRPLALLSWERRLAR